MTAVSAETTQVLTMLGMVTDLAMVEEVATDLGVPDLEHVMGNFRLLHRHTVAWLISVEFSMLDDGGLAFVLAARDKLRVHLGYAAPDPGDEILTAALGPKREASDNAGSQSGDSSSQEDDDSDFVPSDENEGSDASSVRRRKSTRQSTRQATRQSGSTRSPVRRDADPAPRKELKLTGVIGKPTSKGTLSLSSLKSQIRMARNRHYRDSEIVAAVIRIMSPRLDLRSYFEERRELSVKDLLFHLEAHYQKKDVKSLFNQLGAAVMKDGQSAAAFAYQLMGERDRLKNLPKRERGSYSKKLIQAQFQRALYTGMRNQVARRELKSLLCGDNVPGDDEIIEEISNTCMVDGEHQSKLAAFAARRRNAVADGSSSDSKSSSDSVESDKVVKKKTQ